MEVTKDVVVLPVPTVGSKWMDPTGDLITTDHDGVRTHDAYRFLTVDEVVPSDPNGREVRGWIESGQSRNTMRYATSLKIFHHVWQPVPPKPEPFAEPDDGRTFA